jgi:hypothetical protein
MTGETKIPEQGLQDLVGRLRENGGENLLSVVLYGSAVSGGFNPYSNLNLLCVIRDASFAALEKLAPALTWWSQQKQRLPLLMTPLELQRSADVFAIELMDMKANYRMLHGEDMLRGLEIPMHLHRAQLEYELREKLILLRQHLLLASGNDAKTWDLLARALPSFATLFRHALMAAGQPAPSGKREGIEALAKVLQFDAAPFLQVLEARDGSADPKKLNLRETASRYLAGVEQVTAAVDRILDPGQAG